MFSTLPHQIPFPPYNCFLLMISPVPGKGKYVGVAMGCGKRKLRAPAPSINISLYYVLSPGKSWSNAICQSHNRRTVRVDHTTSEINLLDGHSTELLVQTSRTVNANSHQERLRTNISYTSTNSGRGFRSSLTRILHGLTHGEGETCMHPIVHILKTKCRNCAYVKMLPMESLQEKKLDFWWADF